MNRMETRLLTKGRMEEFNRQFQDNVSRGVFRPISSEQASQYKGPVNYISMVEAFKNGPFATTPLRICMNSSMRQPQPSKVSLNDCLLKGPPALADLYTVTLGIREHKVAFTKDISKFYQCVEADEAAQHVKRVLWRFGNKSKEPTIFVTTRVNYGDRPAGCIAIAAVRETADRFGEGKDTAAWFLKNRTYVDDATGGAATAEAARQVSQDMEDILANGGFWFKETVMSRDPLERGGELRKVLGLRWDTQKDEICVDIRLNYGEKMKGAYLEEDAPLSDPESALTRSITRRVLWRVAQSQYDPLGLLSVYMVRWKLLMRKVTLKGKEGGWETPLDREEKEEFRQLLRDLKELREIRFPRCVQPLEGQFKNAMLMVFGDGSREACCTLVYLRWERDDGSARCCLVTGKTQVAPKVKITIPRMELVAAVNSVRLAKKVREALKVSLSGTRYFTNSSAVLGMLRTESGKFLEFVGARMSEVKVNSDVENEWRWLEGNCNPADLGTRSRATPKDMVLGSEYQVGMPWMVKPENTWPCRKSFSPAPVEELRKDMREGACYVASAEGPQELEFPEVKRGGLDRLIRVYGYVMAAVYKWRKKAGAAGPVIINSAHFPSGSVLGYPSLECLRAAELFLLERTQKKIGTSRVRSLNVDTITEEDVIGVKRKLVVIGTRGRNQIQGVYGQKDLPILAKDHKLSELYVQAAHEEGHEGVISTLHRSRKKVWIMNGRSLADLVKARCTECRLKEKKCAEQKMGPLPDHRVQIGAMFQPVAIDLFGPIEYQQHVKKRQVGKAWGVVFVCTTTSAVHVELMDTYSTDSFLLALGRFMCKRGTPTRFQSDRGEQLVAASKQVATWDFREVLQWAGKRGIEWVLVPTGGQHFNGLAERLIGLLKQQMWRVFEGKKYSHEEIRLIIEYAAQSVNSRAIAPNPTPEGEPLSVQDLMLGRAKPGQVEVKFETSRHLVRRFENVQQVKQDFWKRWIEEAFPVRLRQQKWKQEKRDLKVGDIVLRKDETAAGQTYKYARVIKVHVSTDGLVRSVDIEYRLPGEMTFRTTTRPVHKLVTIFPIEEQLAAAEVERERVTRSGQPAPAAPGEPVPPMKRSLRPRK
jgi:hypothetical protein